MKSIKNQYNLLKEGKLSQYNFMRNLRITLPQYISNSTSFNDALKILKNKNILNEADVKCGCGELDPSEFNKGVKHELEFTKDIEKVEKQVKNNLKKDRSYYSKLKLSGDNNLKKDKEFKGDKLVVVDKNNLKDKINSEKTPKGVQKIKASANKSSKETIKPSKGIQIQTEKAKKAKGVKETMKQSGGKTKNISLKEMFEKITENHIDWDSISEKDIINLMDYHKRTGRLPYDLTYEKYNELVNKFNNHYDESNWLDLSRGYGLEDILSEDHLDSKEDKIEYIKKSGHYVDSEELDSKTDSEIDYIYKSIEKIDNQRKSNSSKYGVDLGASFNKFKSQLKEIIKEVIKEKWTIKN